MTDTTVRGAGPGSALLATVRHHAFAKLDGTGVAALLRPKGLLADIKGLWRDVRLPDGIRR